MRINHVEIQNFRKLKSVRIDFSKETTLLVGANNSGKTSAMIALRHFLIDRGSLTTNDFTLSNWAAINAIGSRWQNPDAEGRIPEATLDEWNSVLPSLDIWLSVKDDEIHFVRHLIPTLDWDGGLLGVRLRCEPKDPVALQTEFLTAIDSAKATKAGASKVSGKQKADFTLSLWPECLLEFLERKLRTHFTIRAYILDPAKQTLPVNGIANPQPLEVDALPIEGDPFEGLIVIHEIHAHRGMEDAWGTGTGDGEGQQFRRVRLKLSEQLRSYYSTHLDPSDEPEPADLEALQAIEDAQKAFDDRLTTGFKAAIGELEQLNYPGVADPKLTISTRVRPLDGLNHQSAVRYEVACKNDGASKSGSLRLPEDYNGLGFQNLISMVFKLMSFRDSWLKVGKAGKRQVAVPTNRVTHPPLHLVLIEEPEAHLHVQVQQVFVRKAYEVLRNHPDLRDNKSLHTQLIVSTHSSHVAHESQFDCLRYFRRVRPAALGDVPTATVINLSEVFGKDDETAKFVTRYLRSTHCELFFADAAILVEGAAERMLIPHFIRKKYEELNHRFVTLLEISGSHAHRFQPLIEHLGLCTLVISDLDAKDADTSKAVPAKRGARQTTGNPTLLKWHPKKDMVDDLLGLTAADKQLPLPDGQGCVRIVFQEPVQINLGSQSAVECLATTFEDALILENCELFKALDGTGIFKKVKDAIAKAKDAQSLCDQLFKIIRDGNKAEFALDLLWADKPRPPVEAMNPPTYIADGLEWLQRMLQPEAVVVIPSTQEAAL
ncbi:MAG TPA: AAA family ATPase [Planctomicrobium sp.]|nr:AAA family ATPase [Planctomicrobium sp.]